MTGHESRTAGYNFILEKPLDVIRKVGDSLWHHPTSSVMFTGEFWRLPYFRIRLDIEKLR